LAEHRIFPTPFSSSTLIGISVHEVPDLLPQKSSELFTFSKINLSKNQLKASQASR